MVSEEQDESLCLSFKRKLPALDIERIEQENEQGEAEAIREDIKLLEETLLSKTR